MNAHQFLLTLVLVGASQVHAAELERLFYTQSEREQLERQYALSAEVEGSSSNSRALIVNGVIQREGGKRIIWLNGKQQEPTAANKNSPATVPIVVPGKSTPVDVKVGQRLILDQGATQPDK